MIRYIKFYFIFCLLPVYICVYGQIPAPSERNIIIEEPVIVRDSLPKISLPDFVITGQEKINVESSKKLDFEGDRIFSLDKAYNFINKDVITKTTDIPFKNLTGMEKILGFNGFLKAQAGNFSSYDISGGLGYSYDIYSAALYGSYLSRKEHNMKYSDFSAGNIGVTLGAHIPKTDNIFSDALVKFNVGYDAKNYNNYGSWLPDDYVGIRPHPREYNSFLINSSIVSSKEEYFNYRVNIFFNKYENNVNYFIPNYPPPDIEENKFSLSAGGDYRYEGIDFSGDILFYNNSYFVYITEVLATEEHVRRGIDKNSFIFGLFGSGSAEISNNFFITAGFKFYTYNYLYSLTEDKDVSKGSILPQLELKYENRNNFSLSVVYNPDLKIMDFQQLYKLNPYAIYQEINHSLKPIDIFLRFDISAINNLRILTDVGYLEEKHTSYFYSYDYYQLGDLDIWIPATGDYYSYLHDASAKGIYCNLKMEYNINEFNMVSLGFNYQNKKIDSLRVPFVPQVRTSLNYYLLLDNNKLKINPSIEFIGDRVSPEVGYRYIGSGYFKEEKEDAVVLVNLDVEYSIIKNLAANLTMTNILNSKYSYYYGYQEYPFSVFAGLKLKW